MKSWTLALAMPLLALQGCVANGDGGGLGCDSFGTSAEEMKIAAFVDAAAEFDRQSSGLEAEIKGACDSMAQGLGITVPAPMANETAVQASCGAVSDEIRAIVRAALPTNGSLMVVATPVRCSIDVDAYASCVAECDVNVTVNNTLMCSPGAVRVGRCEASCSGECRVTGMAACEGSCRGTCSGSCTGECYGTCNGTCETMDAMGNCAGACDGTCMGSCSASCEGTCEGTCVAEVNGSCTGQCAGECSVEFEEPRCEGGVEVNADAQCEAACEARLDAQVECTEPELTITVSSDVNESERARFELLLSVLRAEYPNFLAIQKRIEGTVAAATSLAGTLEGAASGAIGLSIQATACVAQSAAATAQAAARVNVSFSASVEVSGSLSANASGG